MKKPVGIAGITAVTAALAYTIIGVGVNVLTDVTMSQADFARCMSHSRYVGRVEGASEVVIQLQGEVTRLIAMLRDDPSLANARLVMVALRDDLTSEVDVRTAELNVALNGYRQWLNDHGVPE